LRPRRPNSAYTPPHPARRRGHFYYDPGTGSPQFARPEFLSTEPNYTFALYAAAVPLPANGALVAGRAYTDTNISHTLVGASRAIGRRWMFWSTTTPVFDHYFITAIAAEINALDTGAFVDWQRTGEAFAGLAGGRAGSPDVCRFFSAAFAPQSSHFYTPLGWVKRGPGAPRLGRGRWRHTPAFAGICLHFAPDGRPALHVVSFKMSCAEKFSHNQHVTLTGSRIAT